MSNNQHPNRNYKLYSLADLVGSRIDAGLALDLAELARVDAELTRRQALMTEPQNKIMDDASLAASNLVLKGYEAAKAVMVRAAIDVQAEQATGSRQQLEKQRDLLAEQLKMVNEKLSQ